MFRIKRITPILPAVQPDTPAEATSAPAVLAQPTSAPAVAVVPTDASSAATATQTVVAPPDTRPQGLLYYPGSISQPLAAELLDWLTSPETTGWFPVGGGANSRQVMHFGYSYDYRSGSVSDPASTMPDILLRLRAIIASTIELPPGYTFDQCIINRYEPRQGISAHIDRQPQYGPIVACFTIGSGAEMEFSHPTQTTYRLYVEPRSLYAMTGESRTIWKHAMRGRLTDPGHGARSVRYSITFRSVTA